MKLTKAQQLFVILCKKTDPPTAIIGGNDVLEFRAILESKRIGIRITDDVSIIGFDDLVLSKHLNPSLSTIQIPTEEMWCRAADTLLALLDGNETQKVIESCVSLLFRESTGIPPKPNNANYQYSL